MTGAAQAPRHFVFVLVEDFAHLAFACAVEPLRIANLVREEPLYSWSFASANGKTATCAHGSVLQVHHGLDDIPPCDHLFVLSGLNMTRHATPPLLAMLRRQHRHGTRIGALCSGAWILAEAGLLQDRKAAIHWEYHDAFMEAFDEVNLVRSVFVADEAHMTASGGTATADLMLHLVRCDFGADLAMAVADQMVYSAVREASAAQKVSLQSRNGMRSRRLVKAIELMQASIEAPLSQAEIAESVGISARQLERLFGKYLNSSPKKYFMEMRLEKARQLLIQTESSVTEVGLACGFDNPGHFARVYKAAFGVTPIRQKGRIS